VVGPSVNEGAEFNVPLDTI